MYFLNLKCLFMTHLFFSLLLLYLRHYCVLNNYKLLLLIKKIFSIICLPNSPLISPITLILSPKPNGLSTSKFELSNLFLTSSVISLYMNKLFFECFYMDSEAVCIHITRLCIFPIFWFYIIKLKFIHYSFT